MKLTTLLNTSNDLFLRTATQDSEIEMLRQSLNREHYLKAGRPAGHILWQGIYESNPEDDTSTLVAVLCWGAAAKHLKSREEFIQWDQVTCANRLKLVVQLRRFLVIDAQRRPNLASQCIGISLQKPPRRMGKSPPLPPSTSRKLPRPQAAHRHTLQSHQLDTTRPNQRIRTPQSRLLPRPKVSQTTLGNCLTKKLPRPTLQPCQTP